MNTTNEAPPLLTIYELVTGRESFFLKKSSHDSISSRSSLSQNSFSALPSEEQLRSGSKIEHPKETLPKEKTPDAYNFFSSCFNCCEVLSPKVSDTSANTLNP